MLWGQNFKRLITNVLPKASCNYTPPKSHHVPPSGVSDGFPPDGCQNIRHDLWYLEISEASLWSVLEVSKGTFHSLCPAAFKFLRHIFGRGSDDASHPNRINNKDLHVCIFWECFCIQSSWKIFTRTWEIMIKLNNFFWNHWGSVGTKFLMFCWIIWGFSQWI